MHPGAGIQGTAAAQPGNTTTASVTAAVAVVLFLVAADCRLLTISSEGVLLGQWTEIQVSYVEDIQGIDSILQEISAIQPST
jgi:hypothetical protein